MKKTVLLLVVLLLGYGSVWAAASAGDAPNATISAEGANPAMEAKLRELITVRWKGYLDGLNAAFPGVIEELHKNKAEYGLAMYVLTNHGGTFVSTGFGKIDEKVHFRAASVTKTFTSAAIMLLHQQGLLRIDDKITAMIPGKNKPYVPEDKEFQFPYRKEMTIRQVLEHRAGIMDINNDPISASSTMPYAGKRYVESVMEREPDHTFTVKEMFGVITANNLSYQPPEKNVYHYSDSGYNLLAEIVEQVTGKTFGEFVTENLLKKNGLNDSTMPFLGTDQDIPKPFTVGYSLGATAESKPLIVETTRSNVSMEIGCGNLITTPRDLATWGKRLYSGVAGLSSETIALVRSGKIEGGTVRGLGCMVLPEYKLMGHNGGIMGCLTSMQYDPENDLCVVIFTNFADFAVNLADEVRFLNKLAAQARDIASGK